MSLPLFDKAVADTSVMAYRALNLPLRERAVLDALRQQHAPPTAYELFQWMRARGLADDLNSVRPRLTGLYGAGRVNRLAKRPCRITGVLAYTWGPR